VYEEEKIAEQSSRDAASTTKKAAKPEKVKSLDSNSSLMSPFLLKQIRLNFALDAEQFKALKASNSTTGTLSMTALVRKRQSHCAARTVQDTCVVQIASFHVSHVMCPIIVFLCYVCAEVRAHRPSRSGANTKVWWRRIVRGARAEAACWSRANVQCSRSSATFDREGTGPLLARLCVLIRNRWCRESCWEQDHH
jgi:hypothetical protein